MSDSSEAFLKVCVSVCTECACVYKCPGAWGWESGGVQKAAVFFTEELKEQPSLMDYFQLRILVSHPASIVIADSASHSLNLFGLQRICSSFKRYVKTSISVTGAVILSEILLSVFLHFTVFFIRFLIIETILNLE